MSISLKKFWKLIILICLLGNALSLVMTDNISNSKASISENRNPITSATKLLWNYTMGDGGRGLKITPDGKYLVAGSWDQKIYLFDTSNPVPIWVRSIPGMVGVVTISDNGEYIAATSSNSVLYFFNRSSSIPLWNFTAGDLIRSLDFTPDGQYLAVGSDDFNIYLFERTNPTPIWNYSLGNRVKSVVISSDGTLIAGGGTSLGVHMYNISQTAPLIWVNNSMSSVYSLDLTPDDKYLVAGSLAGVNGKISLYHALDPHPLQEFETSHTFGHVSISADGLYFTGSVSFENRVYLFERGKTNPVWNFTAEDQIEQAEISLDGNYIACGSYDNKVYLFQRENVYANLENQEMLCLQVYETNHYVFSVELSETGEYLAIISNDDNVYMFHNILSEIPEDTPSISFGNFFIVAMILSILTLLFIRIRARNRYLKTKI